MSFSDIQNAIDRQYNSRNTAAKVSNINDIKMILSQLNKQNGRDDSNTTTSVGDIKLSSKTTSKSIKQLIVEGMSSIRDNVEKHRQHQQPITVNGKQIKQPIFYSDQARHTVDSYIESALGAKRDGLTIYWDIDTFRYKYDIFTNKLTRVDR